MSRIPSRLSVQYEIERILLYKLLCRSNRSFRCEEARIFTMSFRNLGITFISSFPFEISFNISSHLALHQPLYFLKSPDMLDSLCALNSEHDFFVMKINIFV